MASLTLKHLFFAAALLCIACSRCRAQDAVQIVASAALCFDNRTVINGCLQSMGINLNGTANATNANTSNHTTGAPPAPTGLIPFKKNITASTSTSNATAGLCNGPCFGQMMLIMNCVNGIMANFQGYNPGLMQGVMAIFQMSCGVGSGNNSSGGSQSDGGSGGSLAAAHAGNMTIAPNNGNELIIPKLITSWIPIFLATLWLQWSK
ncbi:uncharacterized protein LOC109709335 isoform X2 [Ananas comosus]|uniref:Uncharacterized protein LOC109709335 isoform X2 n=1 Tax=Ananas comosus TaxID=4615 RepID=A0A6P5ETN0_ANACO|nr:uncharacterized protein LOC109709335 isoform X2 [Ananas comosus]